SQATCSNISRGHPYPGAFQRSMTCAVVRDGTQVLALTCACPRVGHCLSLVRAGQLMGCKRRDNDRRRESQFAPTSCESRKAERAIPLVQRATCAINEGSEVTGLGRSKL